MARDLMYIISGYLLGSVLFARVFSQAIYRRDVTEDGDDKNPGTFNAFKCGGFLLGVLTLICDLAKGIIPVYMYIRGAGEGEHSLALAFVICAPVVGHAFPVFYRFRGGKGIAVSFGTLIGLFPDLMPGLFLAAAFIFFSVIIIVNPHYYRTIAAYSAANLLMLIFSGGELAVTVGFLISSVCVNIRLLRSAEEKETLEVRPAWKH